MTAQDKIKTGKVLTEDDVEFASSIEEGPQTPGGVPL